jgi:hypothetical protein
MLLAHTLLAWRARSPALLTNGDDSRYFLLADSLRRLRYANIWEVGQPLERDYPPVYPALLSLWGVLGGDNYDWLLVLNIVASVASLLVLFVVLKRLWSPTVALLGLLAVFANPKLILVAGLVRPESLYLALSLSALALAAASRSTGWHRFASGFAAILGALARIPGIALLGALGLFWLQKRRFRAAVTLALSSTVLVGAWLYVSLMSPSLADSGTYGEDVMRGVHSGVLATVRDQAARASGQVANYLGRILPQDFGFPAVPGTILDNLVVGGTLALLAAIGLFLLYRRWPPAAYYLLAYGCVLVLWPWRSWRFVVPVLPLIATAVVLGAGAVAARLWPRLRTPAALMAALTLAVAGALATEDLIDRADRCDRGRLPPAESCLTLDQRSFFQAADFVNREVSTDAVFFSWKTEPLYLYTQRLTVDRRWALDVLDRSDATGLGPLATAGVTHVLLSHLHPGELSVAGKLESHCSELHLLAEYDTALVFELVGRDGWRIEANGRAAESGACRALSEYRQATIDAETGESLLDFNSEWPPPNQEAVVRAR